MLKKLAKLSKKAVKISFVVVTFLGPWVSVMRNSTGMAID